MMNLIFPNLAKHRTFCSAESLCYVSQLLVGWDDSVPPVAVLVRLKWEKLQALEEGTFRLQACGTTQTSTGWHASVFECLLGSSLKPARVSWRARGMPNISPRFAKSALACIWSLSALCLLASLRISLGDPQDVAETLLENSYLHTHLLVHLHIPVCAQTHTLSGGDMPRQGMVAHSYMRLLRQLCGCTVLCVSGHIFDQHL